MWERLRSEENIERESREKNRNSGVWKEEKKEREPRKKKNLESAKEMGTVWK